MSVKNILSLITSVIKERCFDVNEETMEDAVNILMKEQRSLILETVKRSDATNVEEIMEEINKRISKEHLVLLAERLANIIRSNNMSMCPDHNEDGILKLMLKCLSKIARIGLLVSAYVS